MRIFSGLKEAYKEVERDLVEMGSSVKPETYQDQNVRDNPGFETKEIQGYTFMITSQVKLREDFEELGGKFAYILKEFSDRVCIEYLNPGNSWSERAKVWTPFIHKGKFSYTYNERIREQLPIITQELIDRPSTRQAVLTIFDRHQDIAHLGGRARVPCSMHYQFLIRKRQGEALLDMIYVMRSCDIYTHLIYDIYLAMKLQEFVAHSIGLEPGNYTHFIGSLHAYRKDYETKGVF